MHSIRSSAQRQAWYPQDEASLKYNPFARYRAPALVAADEEALPRTTSGTGLSPERVIRRRRTEGDFQGNGEISAGFAATNASDPGIHDGTCRTIRCANIQWADHEQGLNMLTATGAITVEHGNPEGMQEKLRPLGKQHTHSSEPESALSGKKRHPGIQLVVQFRSILGTWASLLFVFVPVGFAVNYTQQTPVIIFVMNFLAIIPSNVALAFAVEQVLLYVGSKLGVLISMSFGNAVQLISSILLLKTLQFGVLRSSLVGSMLQNLLLMTGLSFFLGGYNRTQQYFNVDITRTMSIFLLVAFLGLTVPAMSQIWGFAISPGIDISRGTAVMIMLSYLLWLVYQHWSHRSMFQEANKRSPTVSTSRKKAGEASKVIAYVGAASVALIGGQVNMENLLDEDSEDEVPQLSWLTALATMIIFTVLLALHTQFATDSIQGLMASHGVSPDFMGIVILPILSNDPLSIESAIRDEMGISLALILERCMQTALMVVPLIVFVAWGLGIDGMSLNFDGFSLTALYASTIIVTYVVQAGRSNWLTGVFLIVVFAIIGLGSFYTN